MALEKTKLWLHNQLYILALCDECGRAVLFYVGRSNDPLRRLREHFDPCSHGAVQRLLALEGLTGANKCLWEVQVSARTKEMLTPGAAESLLTKVRRALQKMLNA